LVYQPFDAFPTFEMKSTQAVSDAVKELIEPDGLWRDDFVENTRRVLKALLKLTPRELPPSRTLNRVEEVVDKVLTNGEGFEALLAKLAYLRSDNKRALAWIRKAIDLGDMKLSAATRQFPALQSALATLGAELKREKAESAAKSRERALAAARFPPSVIKLTTRNLRDWPSADELMRIYQSNAVIYAANGGGGDIYCERRKGYFYGRGTAEGDPVELFVTKHGAVLCGFDHDCDMAGMMGEPRPAMQKGFPKEFAHLKKRIFWEEGQPKDMSFCVWYLNSKAKWQRAGYRYSSKDVNADGSARAWVYIGENEERAVKALQWYFSREMDAAAIKDVYAHKPLTSALLKKLNSACKLRPASLRNTGYPIA
jgi:hypothetical protein